MLLILEYGALDPLNCALGKSWMCLHCWTGVSLLRSMNCFFLFVFCIFQHEQRYMTASSADVLALCMALSQSSRC